ncbi:MAG TPA: peptidase S51, partial [Thermoanaerobaculia bacterium]
ETAVEHVYAKGGGVGGTSAGLAIQGDFTYDGCAGSVLSSEALANPYHRYVTFTYDFFKWANLQNVITDSHFVARDRMGRTLAFLARQIKDGWATSALGLAVQERTSVVVDRNGLATVMGEGPAYFILADHAPEVCQAGTPLTYSNFKIWKVPAGGTFDLRTRPTTGFYLRSVNNGVISADPY